MRLPRFFRQLNKPKALIVIRRVVGHSMIPVLPPQTIVLGRKLWRRPRAGDIVIISHQGKEKIKRVSNSRKEEVYVIGDHLEASTDSRHFGWLPRSAVVAKIFWPRDRK